MNKQIKNRYYGHVKSRSTGVTDILSNFSPAHGESSNHGDSEVEKERRLENGAIGFLIFVIILAVTLVIFKLDILLVFLNQLT